MPSTHTSLHYHIVFSTKDRCPFIKSVWRGQLHAFLGGTVKTAKGVPLSINGTEDHVHLLLGLRATHCLADVVQDIKQTSSKWTHDAVACKEFVWQPGYGAFTVSASNLDAVIKYIAG